MMCARFGQLTEPLTSIEKKVLDQIKPKASEYDLMKQVFSKIRRALSSILDKYGIEAEITLQGSIAHDTWLSGERDMDVFVLFPKTWSVDELKGKGFKILLEAAEKFDKYTIRYAEHPYVRVIIDSVEVDLVPAFKLDDPSEIRTAVDRTPFHTKYVRESLRDELKDHVRLLKKFLRSLGIYGAEIKTKGFSGYLCELLIIAYDGFRDLLRGAKHWKPPVRINALGDDIDFDEVFERMVRRYPGCPMYVPDPVDPRRNVAAAVSLKNVITMKIASYCYLTNPRMEYFFPPDEEGVDKDLLREQIKRRCIVLIILPVKEQLPPDVLWGELQRVADRASKVLKNFDFMPFDQDVWTDEKELAIIAIEIDECSKPYPRLYYGPSSYSLKRVHSFIRSHVLRNSFGPWINEKGELMSLSTRRYSDVKKLLVERAREYIVTPHFRGLQPRIELLDEYIDELREDALYWLALFVRKRPYWMDYCIE